MTEKLKGYLGWAIIIALIAVSYGILKYADAYSESVGPASYRSFAVSGEGKAVAVPDILRFTFSVNTQGGLDLGKLQTENTEKINDAIEFVVSKGVDKKDIKTEYYQVEPRMEYYSCPVERSDAAEPCPPPSIAGYTVRQTVGVKVRDFEVIGEILSGVVENGANEVSQLQFTIDDPSALESQAREAAVKQALEKARAVARAGGFKVGRLLSIDEGVQPYYPMYEKAISSRAMGMGGAEDAAVPVPSVEPGSQDVVINITARYEIK